jgi:hypothetical protein
MGETNQKQDVLSRPPTVAVVHFFSDWCLDYFRTKRLLERDKAIS